MLLKGHDTPQDAEDAFRWCCEAAEQGLAPAQLQLGDLYSAGQGVIADIALAHAWYEKAAEQGDANAPAKLSQLREGRAAGAG